MIRKILGIFLITLFCFTIVFGLKGVGENENSRSSTESVNTPTKNFAENVIKDSDVKGTRVNFNNEVTIAGIGPYTSFELENVGDLITVKSFTSQNPSLSATVDDQIFEEYEKDKYDAFVSSCSENPIDCGTDYFSMFKRDNPNFGEDEQEKIYDDIVDLERDLREGKELSSDEEQELSQKKEFLKNTMTGTDFVNQVIAGADPEEIEGILNDCWGIVCYFGNKITAETTARSSVIEAKQEITQGKTVTNNCPAGKEETCISVDEYNSQLEQKLNDQIKFEELDGCDSLSCDPEDIQCGDDAQTCMHKKDLISIFQNEKEQQEYRSFSGWGQVTYAALTSLLNPDSQGLEASKFFGLDSDLSDLPTALGESYPSQVCLYEIDGYLDSTKDTNVNGVSGVTQYRCLEGRNCLDAAGDIRAQKTPLTPNDEVEVSLSGFIQAPENSSIEMEIFANYVVDNENVEELLFETNVSRNGKESVFEIYSLPDKEGINFSNYDDSNEITINLVGKYSSGGTYVDITTPAYSVLEGVDYEDPLRQQ